MLIVFTYYAFLVSLAYQLHQKPLTGDFARYVVWTQQFTENNVLPAGQMPLTFFLLRFAHLFTNNIPLIIDVLSAGLITAVGLLLFLIIKQLTRSSLAGYLGFMLTMIPSTRIFAFHAPPIYMQLYRESFLATYQYTSLAMLADCSILKNLLAVVFLLSFIFIFHNAILNRKFPRKVSLALMGLAGATFLTHILPAMMLVLYTALITVTYLPFTRIYPAIYTSNPFPKKLGLTLLGAVGMFLIICIIAPQYTAYLSPKILPFIGILTNPENQIFTKYLIPQMVVFPALGLTIWLLSNRGKVKGLSILFATVMLLGFMLMPYPDPDGTFQFRATVMACIPYTILLSHMATTPNRYLNVGFVGLLLYFHSLTYNIT